MSRHYSSQCRNDSRGSGPRLDITTRYPQSDCHSRIDNLCYISKPRFINKITGWFEDSTLIAIDHGVSTTVDSNAQGMACSLSGDGRILAIGAPDIIDDVGGVWIFTHLNGIWTQDVRLSGTGSTDGALQGSSCSLSEDGHTLAIGAPGDNGSVGATWIFINDHNTWSQQGDKLIGTGGADSYQGTSCSLSADGDTLAIGAPNDNEGTGATWIFTRLDDIWTQQGDKLIGDSIGSPSQGTSCSLSGDGNILAIGGPYDNMGIGATWIFTRLDDIWSEQYKLVGSGYIGQSVQGSSCALSSDGRTLAIGGPGDNGNIGATWIFTQTDSIWTQQGNKLVGSKSIGTAFQGSSCSLSFAGNVLAVGGSNDNGGIGATWIFIRLKSIWSQQAKIIGSHSIGSPVQGSSCSLASDGRMIAIGGPNNNNNTGATWVFVYHS